MAELSDSDPIITAMSEDILNIKNEATISYSIIAEDYNFDNNDALTIKDELSFPSSNSESLIFTKNKKRKIAESENSDKQVLLKKIRKQLSKLQKTLDKILDEN